MRSILCTEDSLLEIDILNMIDELEVFQDQGSQKYIDPDMKATPEVHCLLATRVKSAILTILYSKAYLSRFFLELNWGQRVW